MYEQVSHSLLNDILDNLKTEISKQDLRHFYTRLGANFYAIHSLFEGIQDIHQNITNNRKSPKPDPYNKSREQGH